jgi:GNAT superfamily N-acetyltransferase
MLIRQATFGDEVGIAALHMHSWQCSYHSIMPDDILHDLTPEDRRQQWMDALYDVNQNTDRKVLFVVEQQGEIIGFICGGEARADKREYYDAELYAIYVEQAHQGQGIGQKLFYALTNWLIEKNFKNMFVWVFADNPFIGFYQKIGGALGDEHRINESLGMPLKVVHYSWPDLQRFQNI